MTPSSSTIHEASLLGDQHHQPIFLMSPCVLLALRLNTVVICLGYANKLAVITPRTHDASVIQLVHGW